MTEIRVDQVVREIESYRPDPAPPLARLTAAVLAAERLAAVGDEVVDHFVQQARAAGLSWSDIGQCMGVSKQAAQQRFVPDRDTRDPGEPEGSFAEFDRSVVGVVGRANDEASRLGHRYVGTEHLLLGLFHDPSGVAARMLVAAGAERDAVRAEAERIVGRGEGGGADQRPLTPRSRKVFELALREARDLQAEAPGPEHVLLGLLREGKGVAVQVLVALGVDVRELRTRLTGQSG
jgi:hypothetical protein